MILHCQAPGCGGQVDTELDVVDRRTRCPVCRGQYFSSQPPESWAQRELGKKSRGPQPCTWCGGPCSPPRSVVTFSPPVSDIHCSLACRLNDLHRADCAFLWACGIQAPDAPPFHQETYVAANGLICVACFARRLDPDKPAVTIELTMV